MAVIDAFGVVKGEGNHKGCPYREGWCERTVVRAGAERGASGVGVGWAAVGAVIDAFGVVKGEGNHEGCPYGEVRGHRVGIQRC